MGKQVATAKIEFERNASFYTVTVDGLPNGVSDADVSNLADVMKVADVVENNLDGSGVTVSSIVVTSDRTV